MERLGDLTRRMYGDRAFIRTALALGLAKGSRTDARAFAAHMARGQWSDTPDVPDAVGEVNDFSIRTALKTVVPVTDLGVASVATMPFAEGVRRETIPGRLLTSYGARKLPFIESAGNARIVGVGAAWRKAGDAIIVAESEFDDSSLEMLGVGGMIVATKEYIEFATRDTSAADTLDAMLRGQTYQAVDTVFASNDAAVADESPAGVLRGASTISSTGATPTAIAADFGNAVQRMTSGGVSMRSVAVLSSPEAATYLRLLKITDASGQTLAGLPIIDTAPSGTLALIATEFLGIAMADLAAVEANGEGTVQMRTDPDGTATNVVSLWQKNLIAIRTTAYVNWTLVGNEDSNGKFAAVSIVGAAFA
jgi:hypothetical protein